MKTFSIDDLNRISTATVHYNRLQQLRHPFILKTENFFYSASKFSVISEYCNGGELFYHLKNVCTFEEHHTKFFAAELVLGLEYLHSQNLCFRDGKPERILLDSGGMMHRNRLLG